MVEELMKISIPRNMNGQVLSLKPHYQIFNTLTSLVLTNNTTTH